MHDIKRASRFPLLHSFLYPSISLPSSLPLFLFLSLWLPFDARLLILDADCGRSRAMIYDRHRTHGFVWINRLYSSQRVVFLFFFLMKKEGGKEQCVWCLPFLARTLPCDFRLFSGEPDDSRCRDMRGKECKALTVSWSYL